MLCSNTYDCFMVFFQNILASSDSNIYFWYNLTVSLSLMTGYYDLRQQVSEIHYYHKKHFSFQQRRYFLSVLKRTLILEKKHLHSEKILFLLKIIFFGFERIPDFDRVFPILEKKIFVDFGKVFLNLKKVFQF